MNLRLTLPALFAASTLALFCVAQADTPASAPAANSQQTKMKTCNADASDKKLTGADRKTYMKTCLSAAAAAPAAAPTPTPAADVKVNSQQQKMKTCNADATSQKLTGADRKSFMSTCLKSSA